MMEIGYIIGIILLGGLPFLIAIGLGLEKLYFRGYDAGYKESSRMNEKVRYDLESRIAYLITDLKDISREAENKSLAGGRR